MLNVCITFDGAQITAEERGRQSALITEHRGGLYSYSSAVRGLRRFRMLMTGRMNEKERPQVNSVRFSSSSASAYYSSFSRIRCLKTNILGN